MEAVKKPLQSLLSSLVLGIQLQESLPTFCKKVSQNNRNGDFLFQRRFRCRRHPRIIRSLILGCDHTRCAWRRTQSQGSHFSLISQKQLLYFELAVLQCCNVLTYTGLLVTYNFREDVNEVYTVPLVSLILVSKRPLSQ